MSTPTGSRGAVAAGSSSLARRCEQQAAIDQQREQQLNKTAAEECRLRRLMEQHPPRTPDHGVFVLQADGRAGEPAEPMRQWDPRGLIDPIYKGKRRQRAVAKKAEDLKAKLLKKLDRVANMNDGVANMIRELKEELEKDHNDLHRLILNLNLHWSSIEDDIGREYGYDDPTDDQLKILGLAYTDAVEEWDRERFGDTKRSNPMAIVSNTEAYSIVLMGFPDTVVKIEGSRKPKTEGDDSDV